MKTNIEPKEILAFDSLYNVISWEERLHLHRFILDKEELKITEQMQLVVNYISTSNFEAPKMKYDQDLLLHVEDEQGEWIYLANYITENITEDIKQLQQQNQQI